MPVKELNNIINNTTNDVTVSTNKELQAQNTITWYDIFKKEYIVKDKPDIGPAYILPDGTFIYLDNIKKKYGLRFVYHGIDRKRQAEKYYPIEYKEDNELELITLNDGLYNKNELIIRLWTSNPTKEQYDSLLEWLYYIWYRTLTWKEKILHVMGKENVFDFIDYDLSDNDISPEYIIKRIKRYYNIKILD